MVGIIIVSAIILLFVIDSIYRIWEEHRRGILCECCGDCAKCKIKCRSNVNYYGIRQVGIPAVQRPAAERSLLPENQPLIIRAIRKGRDILDLICYWIFNIFGIFAALSFVSFLLGRAAVSIGHLLK
ncbi:MAG: hypothetical protein IJ071_02890 [Ruminococcus sp.]|nr:hypothetical protein [Ruminococcus sp.]